ncbi:MAG: S8 family serine peptidase, partial [Gemmatimonadetes bacterium]|nr:S8 family serine peptidase [Gemmatimonadota bacterium]
IYTNSGDIVDLSAPGGTFPPLGSLILSTWSPLSFDLPANFVFTAGTSMAAPHVAGAAAQLVGKNGSYVSPRTLRTILEESAEDLGPRGDDDVYGHGLVNVWEALQD